MPVLPFPFLLPFLCTSNGSFYFKFLADPLQASIVSSLVIVPVTVQSHLMRHEHTVCQCKNSAILTAATRVPQMSFWKQWDLQELVRERLAKRAEKAWSAHDI